MDGVLGALGALLLGGFLAMSLQRFLLQSVEDLIGSVTIMTSAAGLVRSTIDTLTESSNEQASAIQQTAASVEEIRAMTVRNNEHTQKSKNKTEEVTQGSSSGLISINELTSAMHEIAGRTEEIHTESTRGNQEMGEVIKVIHDIDEKTRVINDIVFQTRLLSFNASVEAARAGEHGKGFAVVAEEIGELATSSGKAAKDISELLSKNVSRVEAIIKNNQRQVEDIIQSNRLAVQNGMTKTEGCDTAFKSIAGQIQELSALVHEISLASGEQTGGVQEISRAIDQLNVTMQRNADSSYELSFAGTDLHRENSTLVRLADQLAWSVLGGGTKKTAHIDTMNTLDKGIQAHSEWKNRLLRFMNGTSKENLDPAVIGRDDQCALGKWIHGKESALLHHSKHFKELKDHHAHFHKCAAEVVTTVQHGGHEQAKDMIAEGSAFFTTSAAVIKRLVRLKFQM